MLHETEKQYRKLLTNLEPREQHFVSEYLIHKNAARSARTAGYSGRSAKEIGWETLTKPHVWEAVEAGIAMITHRCEVDADKIVGELAAVAFSNISHYRINDEGDVSLEEGAPPEASKAIQSVRRKKRVLDDGSTVYETEYKLWDKIAAITLLGKKLKLWVEKVEVDNPQDELYRELLKSLKEKQ